MSKRFVYNEDAIRERPIKWSMIQRLLSFITKYRSMVITVLFTTAIGTAARLANPWLTAQVIDRGIRQGSVGTVVLFASIVGVMWLITFTANRFRIRNANQVGQSVIYDLRGALYRHIQSLSFRFFDLRPAGSIFVRVMNYVNSLQDLYTNYVISIVLDAMTVVGIMVVMLIMNWHLALLSFVTVPLLILISTKLRFLVRRAWQVVSFRQARINAHLNEAISGMRVTQAFRQEADNQDFFKWVNGQNRDGWFRATALGATFSPLVEFTGALGVGLLYTYGASLIFKEQLSLGAMVAFASYLNSFWEPISRLSQTYTQLLSLMANAEAIFELFDTDSTVPDQAQAKELPAIQGAVTFDHVVFGYDQSRLALKGIDLQVTPGETVALVGHTGSGKSTIINLLLRFYDVTDGRVLIDGHDVRHVTADSLRSQVGVVLQDTFIFAGTVMANIRFARPEATDVEVHAAAKAARAHDFIMRLPKGYEEEVQERGTRLSMGQRQLISFARAMLANPRILILDEATANIDTETEREIQLAVETLLKDRTAFVIAHRLSTIRNADKIVVLDHGEIREMGDHTSLMSQRGHYWDLVQTPYREAGD